MQPDLARRRFLTAATACALLTACDRIAGLPRRAAAQPDGTCAPEPAGQARSVDVVIDRSTVLDARVRTQVQHLLLGAADARGGLWRVFVCGGRDAALVRRVFEGALTGPADSERARWRDSPSARERTARCRAASRSALAAALQTALSDVDPVADGYSPLLEAAHATLAGRTAAARGLLALVSDGLENVPGRSFYGPAGRGIRIPPAARLVDDLKRDSALPDARGVDIVHVAFGWTQGQRAALRPPREIAALEKAWRGVWDAAGARSVTIGLPLPAAGLPG